jgi:hypothetical protein
MIGNLRETTERNAAQDWLNSNLARFSGMLQGQRDQKTVARLLMSEVTPLIEAHHGASTSRRTPARTRRPSFASSPRTATRSERRSRTASRSAKR